MTNTIQTNNQKLRLANLSVGLFSTLRVALPDIPVDATRVEFIVTKELTHTAYTCVYDAELEMWVCDVSQNQFYEVGKQKYEIAYLLDGKQFWDGQGWIDIVKANTEGIVPVPEQDPPRYYISSINGYGASETSGAVRIPRLFTGEDEPQVSDTYIRYDMYFNTISKAMYIYHWDGEEFVWLETAGGSGGIANVTFPVLWSELMTLISSSGLIAGCKYRITDYITTVRAGHPNAAANGHRFDIIVTATSENKICEIAQAVLNEADTYYNTCRLNGWQVWYYPFNDTGKFEWANLNTGKGVIYRLIDEYGNDAPYDFKSITFGGSYTFGGVEDDSQYEGCAGNRIEPYISDGRYILRGNNIGTGSKFCTIGANSEGNTIGNECQYVTIGNNSVGNEVEQESSSVHIGDFCEGNTVRHSSENITIGNACGSNVIGESCSGISVGDYSRENFTGDGSSLISFGEGNENNDVGDGCYAINFGARCKFVVLGDSEAGNYANAHNITVGIGVMLVSFSGMPEGKTLQNVEITSGVYGRTIAVTYASMLYRDNLCRVTTSAAYTYKV